MLTHWIREYTPPVVVGGVGGSGTRLIAQCMRALGFYMGGVVNESNDNLWFTLLFKRQDILAISENEFLELVEIMCKRMTGYAKCTKAQEALVWQLVSMNKTQYRADWLEKLADSLLSVNYRLARNASWGWKEPNSHIVIQRLAGILPRMKYVHVVRNGLDMAYSDNQNQLKLWGNIFLGERYDISPYYSLKFWCTVHRCVIKHGAALGSRFLFLNYDRLCKEPAEGMQRLIEFLGLEAGEKSINSLSALVRVPSSINRYKQYGTDVFDRDDLAYVRQLGFDTGAD